MDRDTAMRAAVARYHAELMRVDPGQEDGVLGASVRQDARYAVDGALAAAAQTVLDTAQQFGLDTASW
jgi:hypothetical protein